MLDMILFVIAAATGGMQSSGSERAAISAPKVQAVVTGGAPETASATVSEPAQAAQHVQGRVADS